MTEQTTDMDVLMRLERAHRLGCSDPSDSTRRTTYGDAAEEIRSLRARLVQGDAALERAATALDDLALTLMTTSEDNPEGNSLTAAVVQKCADIVRQHKGAEA